MKTKENEHVIKEVYSGLIVQEMEVEPGDILLSANHKVTEDVFDYQYLIKDEYIEVVIRKPDGEEWLLEIDRECDGGLGVELRNGLMSDYRSYSNKCIFYFVGQMPPGIRETLYFKDDDSRFFLLQGDYITLINMKEGDIGRIVRMQLAPINISVQTTNLQLRCETLDSHFAGDKLKYLQMLYDGHVEMNGQMACCKNVSDRAELERTIRDLSRYLPSLGSVSVAPAGITKFREGLPPVESYTKKGVGAVIDMVGSRQQKFYEQYGLYFVHASDEWYIIVGGDFPEEKRYDGYVQLENDMGMTCMFIDEFNEVLEDMVSKKKYEGSAGAASRTLTIVTGRLTYPTIRGSVGKLMDVFPHLTVHVCATRNDFFGETITVSGFMTGQDPIGQLKERQAAGEDLGEVLQTPSDMPRVGEQVFLDDPTVRDVERELGMKMVAVESRGREFADTILDPEYGAGRRDDNFVCIQAYDQK